MTISRRLLQPLDSNHCTVLTKYSTTSMRERLLFTIQHSTFLRMLGWQDNTATGPISPERRRMNGVALHTFSPHISRFMQRLAPDITKFTALTYEYVTGGKRFLKLYASISTLKFSTNLQWFCNSTTSFNLKGLTLHTLFHAETCLHCTTCVCGFGIFLAFAPAQSCTHVANMRQDQVPGAISEDRN